MKKIDLVSNKTLKERDAHIVGSSGKSLWDACRDDVILFASKMLGMKLYGWQYLVAKKINEGNKRIIINTSRQIGKSTLAAIVALWYTVFNKASTSEYKNTKVGVISATEDQAKKLMLDIKNMMYIGDAFCRDHYSKDKDDVFNHGIFSYLIDNTQGAENTRTAITFKRYEESKDVAPELLKDSRIGCFIKSLPPTDIVRGNTFDLLIVDEASIIDDDTYNMAISKTGDKYDAIRIMTSTPRGYKGFFYDYFDPEDKFDDNAWIRFWFTIDSVKHDAPEEYEKRLKDINNELARGKYLVVRQEYYGEFVQSESSFFKPKKVDEMIDPDSAKTEKFLGECDMGVDFGGLRNSRTVLTISAFNIGTGEIRRLWHRAYAVKEDAALIQDIEEARSLFNIQRVVVDECPEGDYMIREMEEKGWTITRMVFARDKIMKYGEFRAQLNKGNIKSYADSELVGEMKALQQIDGKTRTQIRHAPGMSDDLTDSFLMSTYHFIGDDTDFDFVDWSEYE